MRRLILILTLIVFSGHAMSESFFDKIGSALSKEVKVFPRSIQIAPYTKLKTGPSEIAMVYGFDTCLVKNNKDMSRCITISGRDSVKVVVFKSISNLKTETWKITHFNDKYRLFRENGFQVSSPR